MVAANITIRNRRGAEISEETEEGFVAERSEPVEARTGRDARRRRPVGEGIGEEKQAAGPVRGPVPAQATEYFVG